MLQKVPEKRKEILRPELTIAEGIEIKGLIGASQTKDGQDPGRSSRLCRNLGGHAEDGRGPVWWDGEGLL